MEGDGKLLVAITFELPTIWCRVDAIMGKEGPWQAPHNPLEMATRMSTTLGYATRLLTRLKGRVAAPTSTKALTQISCMSTTYLVLH